MNEILSFSGQLPEHFDAAFAEIGPELGFARAGQGGLSVALHQGGCLRAEKRADGVVVTWPNPYRYTAHFHCCASTGRRTLSALRKRPALKQRA